MVLQILREFFHRFFVRSVRVLIKNGNHSLGCFIELRTSARESSIACHICTRELLAHTGLSALGSAD